MRWLASIRRPLLAGAFVLLLLAVVFGVVFGLMRSLVISGSAVVALFLLFFATLRAFTAPRETPRPHSPH